MTKPSWQDFATHDESAHPDLWNGVVGYWAPCLGPTGTRLHDVSRGNNWGTLTNMDPATDWVIQGGASALNLTATDFIDCGNPTALNFVAPFAVAAWVKLGSAPTDTGIVSKTTQADGFSGWMLWQNGSVANAYWAGGTRATGTTSIVGDVLQLIGMSWTGQTAEVWVNGKLDGTGSTTITPSAAASPIRIGNYATNNNLDRTARGQYFDAIAWNRRLSPNEWSQLYQLGPGGMLQRRSRRRAYSFVPPAVNIPILTARNSIIGGGTI